MKKIKHERVISYPIVRLFKNDLDDIIDVFNNNCKEIHIEADEYEIDNISQISNIKKESITDFSIRGQTEENTYFDNIRLRLGKSFAYLSMADDTNTTYLGMASQINSIIHKRAKMKTLLNSNISLIIGTVLLTALNVIIYSINLIYYHQLLLNQSNSLITIALSILFLIYIYCFSYIKKKKRTNILLVNTSEKTNFFRRNSDQILLLIIGTILGSVGTIIVTLLTSHNH